MVLKVTCCPPVVLKQKNVSQHGIDAFNKLCGNFFIISNAHDSTAQPHAASNYFLIVFYIKITNFKPFGRHHLIKFTNNTSLVKIGYNVIVL